LALSIAQAVTATGGAISRTRLFSLIGSGEIDARRVGRRTVVLSDSLKAFLDRAPSARPDRTGRVDSAKHETEAGAL
jgi:hypothetical protein